MSFIISTAAHRAHARAPQGALLEAPVPLGRQLVVSYAVGALALALCGLALAQGRPVFAAATALAAAAALIVLARAVARYARFSRDAQTSAPATPAARLATLRGHVLTSVALLLYCPAVPMLAVAGAHSVPGRVGAVLAQLGAGLWVLGMVTTHRAKTPGNRW